MKTFRGPAACRISGITYRQLDYWARTDLIAPSVDLGKGSGYQRVYSVSDVWLLTVCKTLLDSGLSLAAVREVLHDVAEVGGIHLPNGVVITIDKDRLGRQMTSRIAQAPEHEPALQLVGR